MTGRTLDPDQSWRAAAQLLSDHPLQCNDSAIDVVALDRNAEKVSEYCMSNPEATLMKAIETTAGAAR